MALAALGVVVRSKSHLFPVPVFDPRPTGMCVDVTNGKFLAMECSVCSSLHGDVQIMKQTVVNLGVAALLAGASVASQAATMTLNNWTWGNGNNVNATAPAYSGAGGGFSGTLTGASAQFNGNINTYCVELGEFFSFGTANPNYNVLTSVSYFGAGKALQLAKLLSYANPLVAASAAGTKDDLSTALQLAIWNTVYDTDATLSSGMFKDISGYAAQANSFLAGAATQSNYLQLFVLSSGKPVLPTAGNQDQLIWLDGGGSSGGNIPEPTSLALAFGALGALGFATRRRQSPKA